METIILSVKPSWSTNLLQKQANDRNKNSNKTRLRKNFYDKNLKFRPPNVCIRILDLKFKKISVKIQKIKNFIFRTCIFFEILFSFHKN